MILIVRWLQYVHTFTYNRFSVEEFQASLPQNCVGFVVRARNVCDFGGRDSCTLYLLCCDSHF